MNLSFTNLEQYGLVSHPILLLTNKDLVIESMRCPASDFSTFSTTEKSISSSTSETSTCKITVCENCLSRMSLITTGKSRVFVVSSSHPRMSCYGVCVGILTILLYARWSNSLSVFFFKVFQNGRAKANWYTVAWWERTWRYLWNGAHIFQP